MMSRQPQYSYARLRQLLGKTLEHPSVQKLSKTYLPMSVRFNATRGALALGVSEQTVKHYADDEASSWSEWSVEELVAMIFTYAKDITKAYGGHAVRDCVITISSFATQLEREAMIAAAELADLRVLTLMDENTAAALHFGLDRLYEEPKRVLFYNLGADYAQVSVVEYSTWTEKAGGKNKTVGQLEVLGKGWALGVGGHALDLVLAERIADAFNAQWKKGDIRTVPKAMAKIVAAAKKTKEVLSANQEIPMSIPSLHDDIDFRMTFSRAELEEFGQPVFDALEAPIRMALEAANMTADDVDQVEIIGGGIRVPKVQQTLKAFFAKACTNETKQNMDLGLHLNGDEAVALGAAFHGANVSTSFRVRKIGLIDHSPYAVHVKMTDDPAGQTAQAILEAEGKGGLLGGLFGGGGGKEAKKAAEKVAKESDATPWHKRATLFKARSVLGAKPKTIAFQHDADVVVELAYEDSEHLHGQQPHNIAVYNVSGIAAFAAEMAKLNASGSLPRPKVSLSFTLDASGISQLSKAEVSVVEEYEAPVDPPPPPPAKKKVTTKASKAKATTTAAETTNNATGTNNATDAPADDAESTATPPEEEDNKEEEEEEEDKLKEAEEAPAEENVDGEAPPPSTANETAFSNKTTVTKKKTHKKTLSVKRSVHPMSSWATLAHDAEASSARLTRIQDAEQKRMAREAAKNDLESSIYATRAQLEDRPDLADVSTEAQREEVRARCESLGTWLEDEAGPSDAAEVFLSKRAELQGLVGALVDRADEAAKRPAALDKARKALALALKNATDVWPVERPWLNVSDLEDLVAKVDKASKWLDDQVAAQAKLSPSEKPAFSVQEIPSKLKPVASLAAKLLARPRPKPKPPAVKVVNNDTDSANSTDANATDANATAPDPEKDPEDAAQWDEL